MNVEYQFAYFNYIDFLFSSVTGINKSDVIWLNWWRLFAQLNNLLRLSNDITLIDDWESSLLVISDAPSLLVMPGESAGLNLSLGFDTTACQSWCEVKGYDNH